MKKLRLITVIFALLFGMLALTACATAEAQVAEPVEQQLEVVVATPEPTPTPESCADCSSCNCDDADCCVPPCCDSPYCMPGCDKRNCCDECLEAFRARSRERDERWAAEQQTRQEAWDAMSEDEQREIKLAHHEDMVAKGYVLVFTANHGYALYTRERVWREDTARYLWLLLVDIDGGRAAIDSQREEQPLAEFVYCVRYFWPGPQWPDICMPSCRYYPFCLP